MRQALAAFALLAAAAPGLAREWRVDPAASEIVFTYTVNGIPAEGRFTEMAGVGAFDAARPGETRFTLTIDVTSLTLRDPMETAFALSPDWFDAARHPEAQYRLARLEQLPDGRWRALGDLTIKDRLEVVRTPIALDIGAERAEARGTVRFDRRDFGLGSALGDLFVEIGREVSVSFDLVARPVEK